MTGTGTALDPYIIQDILDLQWMNNALTAYYELEGNIDASTTAFWTDIDGDGFVPIGGGVAFTGSFNGKGYTIDQLYINRPSLDYVGLFGLVVNCISMGGYSLSSANITGKDYTGAMIGYIFGNHDLIFCTTGGDIIGHDYVGGVIGFWGASVSGSMDRCETSCNVCGNDRVGGFFGTVSKVNTPDCFATGNVTATGIYVGGFVGYDISGERNRCDATGNVIAGDDGGDSFVGGFVGWANANYVDCYARGDVTATGNYVGGFAGVSGDELNCYSTGLVTGVGAVGGLNGNEGGDTIACFWDTETSGLATSYGGTGKTTAEMKTEATFTDASWDFSTIWRIDYTTNDGYPFFLRDYDNESLYWW